MLCKLMSTAVNDIIDLESELKQKRLIGCSNILLNI